MDFGYSIAELNNLNASSLSNKRLLKVTDRLIIVGTFVAGCNRSRFPSFVRILGPKDDELVIVPDGPLWLAPFAAFLDSESKYLSESMRLRFLPSLMSMKLINASPVEYHQKSGALLVGNPCLEDFTTFFGENKFEPLPCAEKEVKMIGKLLGIHPLTGKEATKAEVLKRIGSVAVVHIAAHGKFDTGEIALAPNPERKYRRPEEQDFRLTISDVQAAKLRAKLVVLSCCHSAQGKVSSEGVVGIARAFLGAGARSVLVALWSIDDEATMKFMESFYENLKKRNSASVSLNRAMKCLRESEKFYAPRFWAPFVLIGDDVTIDFEQISKESFQAKEASITEAKAQDEHEQMP
ncbi:tetratricopeptide repeat protein 28-like [Pocillopora verrucosa]|uniref:tetratricopeptide repeat protein 28-like n=1 Tax=Pocillopora verrucosa TaxID=203993 RepID=UPI00333E7553